MVETVLQWGWLGVIGVNLGIAWVAWSLRRFFVTRKDLDDHLSGVEARLRSHDSEVGKALQTIGAVEKDMGTRLIRVEERMAAMPTHNDLARIHSRLDQVAAGTNRLEAAVQAVGQALKAQENRLNQLYEHQLRETKG